MSETAKINGRWEIKLPPDREIFHRAQVDWEKQRLDSMFKNIQPGDTVLDIGTEVGDYAALMTLWGAKVFCIEPQPLFWPMIKRHFDLNNIKPLGCFAGFISGTTETAPELADFEIGNKKLWPKCAYEELIDWHGFRNVIETGISTPQIRIDDLRMQRDLESIKALTIDVEGAELEVLKSAVTTLTIDKPIVYVSIHPDMMRIDWNQQPSNLIDFMASMGYTGHHIHTDHEAHWVFTSGKVLVL